MRQAEDENAQIDYEAAAAIYKEVLDEMIPYVKIYSDEEIAAMAAIRDILR